MIGTGLAGLLCSRILQDQGLHIQCFEKSYRAGGRASTRVSDGSTQFDHGAQYFTIRDPVLQSYLESWIDELHVAKWEGTIVSIDDPGVFCDVVKMDRFVGTPRMESLGTHLSKDLSINFETEVSTVERGPSGYRLTAKTDRFLGEFDIVLWNCPPLQVDALLPPNFQGWR